MSFCVEPELYGMIKPRQGLKIFIDDNDKSPYRNFAKRLKDEGLTFNNFTQLEEFVLNGEMGAFRTIMCLELPIEEKLRISENFQRVNNDLGQILEVLGTQAFNSGNIRTGVDCYERALALNRLSIDGKASYVFHLLYHFDHDTEKVKKAWAFLQDWQKQLTDNDLRTIYHKLFEVIQRDIKRYKFLLDEVAKLSQSPSCGDMAKLIINSHLIRLRYNSVDRADKTDEANYASPSSSSSSSYQEEPKKASPQELQIKESAQKQILKNLNGILKDSPDLQGLVSLDGRDRVKHFNSLALKILETSKSRLTAYKGKDTKVRDQLERMTHSELLVLTMNFIEGQVIQLKSARSELHNYFLHNVREILKSDTALRTYPIEKKFTEPLTQDEYIQWTKEIIKRKRSEILEYHGDKKAVKSIIGSISNRDLEKFIVAALKDIPDEINSYKQAQQAFQTVVANNVALILRDNPALNNFPKNKKFDLNNLTEEQYTKWATTIIKRKRADIRKYEGTDIGMKYQSESITDEVLLKLVMSALKQIIEGAD